ncbi:MAG: GNAT family N-acetyltransferase [Desulfobacterales bacterium]|nr:GNAT family N-acetyltransferase [Desulfobacterales bacterium]
MTHDIRIELLADNSHLIGAIEKWFEDEWPGYYGPRGLGNARKELETCCNRIKLPIALVAVNDNGVYGTVALKSESASHTHLSPWLAALYVTPEMRRKGLGLRLVKAVEKLAIEMGSKTIYARSDTAADFFERMGWTGIDKTVFQGQELTIFKNDIMP